MVYNHRSEYIDYMISKISTMESEEVEMILKSIELLRFEESGELFVKKVNPIHHHFFRERGLVFLDYSNFKRFKDFGMDSLIK